MKRKNSKKKNELIAGVGLGLRSQHMSIILEEKPKVPWFEILIDNYFCEGGLALHNLEKICEDYPVVFHSVGMSLAASDTINETWFRALKELSDRFQPAWISDHLCWTNNGGHFFHDLLPFPFTEKTVSKVSEKISRVQDILQQEILVENVSSYLSFKESEFDEADFLQKICRKTGCKILLDINNIHVSASNNNFDSGLYLEKIPVESVKQFHLAGYEDTGEYLLDSHSAPVWEPVWDLYKVALARFGSIPTLIEWDNDIPDFEVLQGEANQASSFMSEVEGNDR